MSVAEDDDELAQSAKVKVVAVLLGFTQADRKVKAAMATRTIILRRLTDAASFSLTRTDFITSRPRQIAASAGTFAYDSGAKDTQEFDDVAKRSRGTAERKRH